MVGEEPVGLSWLLIHGNEIPGKPEVNNYVCTTLKVYMGNVESMKLTKASAVTSAK